MSEIKTPIPAEPGADRGRAATVWLAGAAAVHAAAFLFIFKHGNVELFAQADKMFQGLLPYRDFVLEYPPLVLLVLLPPRLFGATAGAYGHALAAELLFFDILILVLLTALARRRGRPAWQPLSSFTAAILALGALSAQRYDLFPVFLVTTAFCCFARGRTTASWIFLGLGTTAKLYPAVLIPLLMLYQARQGDVRGIIKGALAAAAIVLAVALPWVLVSPQGFAESLQYQFGRGLQIETTYASVLIAAQKAGWTEARIVYQNGANNLVSPLAQQVADATPFIVMTALGIIYIAYALRKSGRPGRFPVPSEANAMALLWALALLGFILSSKVLSPQFLLWTMPLLAVAEWRGKWLAWATLTLACALSQYIYPYHYLELMALKTGPLAALVLRNSLLMLIAAVAAREAIGMKSPGHGHPGGPQAHNGLSASG